ncbi:MAG TPA: hypothetical protein VM659_09390 [Dongiaceae bacterium]|nr:hypothetical protein [Dongiaceae bacterium]
MFNPAPKLAWLEAECYAPYGAADGHTLSWEFLRRSPDYRGDYAIWEMAWIEAKSYAKGQPEYPRKWDTAYQATDHICEKWFLNRVHGPRDPLSFMAPVFEDRPIPRAPEVGEIWIDGRHFQFGFDELRHHSAVAVRIYFDRSVEEQFNELRAMLLRYEDQWNFKFPTDDAGDIRRRAAKYPIYLRILDAKAEGATNAEIAKAIYPRYAPHTAQKKIKDDYDRALHIANKDYIKLSHLSRLRK